MNKNSKFLFVLSAGALILTAVCLFLTHRQIERYNTKQNRIEHRIDSMNLANKHKANMIRINAKRAAVSRQFKQVIDKIDSLDFTYGHPIVNHSEIKP